MTTIKILLVSMKDTAQINVILACLVETNLTFVFYTEDMIVDYGLFGYWGSINGFGHHLFTKFANKF